MLTMMNGMTHPEPSPKLRLKKRWRNGMGSSGYSPIPKTSNSQAQTAGPWPYRSFRAFRQIDNVSMVSQPAPRSTLHAPRSTPPPRSLLHTTERLPNLIVQLVKLALDILLALGVGRLELHLRQLEDDIGRRVADLHKRSSISTDQSRNHRSAKSSPPWSTSCRSTRRRAGPARRTRQSCGAYPPSCRRGSIGRTRRYRSAGGSRPGRVSGAHGITTQTIQHGSHRFDPP